MSEGPRRIVVVALRRLAIALVAATVFGTVAPAESNAASVRPAWVGAATTVTPRVNPPTAVTDDPIAIASSLVLAALWVNDSASYQRGLDTLVPLVAKRAKVTASALRLAWSSADRPRMVALLAALTQLGVPYRRNTQLEGVAFDCSGFTSWAWSVAGVKLSKSRVSQLKQLQPSTVAAVKPGDILAYPGHVMMAIGVGEAMIDSPYTGAWVQLRPMYPRRVGKVDVLSPL